MPPQHPSAAALTFWNNAAPEWDASIASTGNDYWIHLQEPCLKRLCAIHPGDRALDLATGNGLVARWLVEQGAGSVLGTDGSGAMLELAGRRTEGQAATTGEGLVRYELLDLVDEMAVDEFVARQGLRHGRQERFDVITANMALMDIETLQPLARLVKGLLRAGSGRFVATMLHPIFFTSGAKRCVEIDEDDDGNRRIHRHVKVENYLEAKARKVTLVLPKPVECGAQMMFHRPIHEVFAPFFAEGLMLDALEERNFDASFIDDARPYGSKSYVQIPKLLAFRLRNMV